MFKRRRVWVAGSLHHLERLWIRAGYRPVSGSSFMAVVALASQLGARARLNASAVADVADGIRDLTGRGANVSVDSISLLRLRSFQLVDRPLLAW